MSPEGAVGSDSERVYHLELRQFPHNFCHFNLAEQELRRTVLEPWAGERWIELGERKWNPNQAKLTVIEGPRIAVDELSMGRGWRTAQREGRDVTAQLLQTAQAGSQAPSPTPPPTADLLADSLGLELLAQVGSEPAPLRRAWELAAARHPGGTASETLAVAEGAVASLLRGALIVLLQRGATDDRVEAPEGGADAPGGGADALDAATRPVGEGETERILRAVESWTGDGEAARVWMRRV
jgi:hypothetical protein